MIISLWVEEELINISIISKREAFLVIYNDIITKTPQCNRSKRARVTRMTPVGQFLQHATREKWLFLVYNYRVNLSLLISFLIFYTYKHQIQNKTILLSLFKLTHGPHLGGIGCVKCGLIVKVPLKHHLMG